MRRSAWRIVGAGEIARRIAGRRGLRVTPHRQSDRASSTTVRTRIAARVRRS